MYVYRFLNKNNEIIYIGKTVELKIRLRTHFYYNCEDWKKEVCYIEYSKLKDGATMSIYEIYYIDRYKPKYNKSDKYLNTYSHILLEDLIFQRINVDNLFDIIDDNTDYNNIDINIFDKESLYNRYVFYISKNNEFIKSNKSILEKKDADFIIKKIHNLYRNRLKTKRADFSYTIYHWHKHLIKSDRIREDNFVLHCNDSGKFALFYLSDIGSNDKNNISNKLSYLYNLLNFMNINKNTDINGNTHLFVCTKQNYELLKIYFDNKINFKYC